MNTNQTKETMKTKVVDTAKVVLELYDLKFEMTCDDLSNNEWLMKISYPDHPGFAPKVYEIDDLYTEDELEMEERIWEEAIWYLKKYHRGADITLENKEIEEEEE